MIHIDIERKNGKVSAMTVEGHAETEDSRDDIVCASISILAQTCVLSLYHVAKVEEITYAMHDGYLEFQMPENLSDEVRAKADIIIETLLIGIQGTQDMHPQYIEICEREVRSDAF